MGLRLFIALLFGGLAYLITVILGLLLQLPLKLILIRGVSFLFLFALSGWLMTFILEKLSERRGELTAQVPPEQKSKTDKEAVEGLNHDFSPLNPPVLETIEKKE